MPQLDKLTFTSQIFWFLFLFIFAYYFFIQMIVLRIKFILGLKRFFLQNDKSSNFYDLVKNLKIDSRNNLIFFFSNNYTIVDSSKGFFSYYIYYSFNYIEKFLPTKLDSEKNEGYAYILEFNKDYSSFVYNNLQKENFLDFKELSYWTKSIVSFYDRLNMLLGFFFRSVQFYIYEVNFTLFYYFFNVFFKFRNTLNYIKLINKI